MERKNIKTFSTGEFAKRFGIKKDTLFYYDKIGLFQPTGVSDNGYRYYTMPQLDIFWAIQSLRELHLPIKELEKYLGAPSPSALMELSKRQLDKVEQEIVKLNEVRTLLNCILTKSQEGINAFSREVHVVELPEEQVLYSETNPLDEDTDDEKWFDYYDVFLKKVGLKGAAYVGSVMDKKDLLSGRFGRVSKLFVQSDSPLAVSKPAGTYAVIYHKGSYDGLPDTYLYLLQAIKDKGFLLLGDAHEEYLIGVLAVKDEADFITKVSVQIKTK